MARSISGCRFIARSDIFKIVGEIENDWDLEVLLIAAFLWA